MATGEQTEGHPPRWPDVLLLDGRRLLLIDDLVLSDLKKVAADDLVASPVGCLLIWAWEDAADRMLLSTSCYCRWVLGLSLPARPTCCRSVCLIGVTVADLAAKSERKKMAASGDRDEAAVMIGVARSGRSSCHRRFRTTMTAEFIVAGEEEEGDAPDLKKILSSCRCHWTDDGDVVGEGMVEDFTAAPDDGDGAP
ncbi:hypothetical protein ACLOJK_034680, partial [Asimina triloba]